MQSFSRRGAEVSRKKDVYFSCDGTRKTSIESRPATAGVKLGGRVL
jgi:hypothetical protein